jgi:hypothetical protein
VLRKFNGAGAADGGQAGAGAVDGDQAGGDRAGDGAAARAGTAADGVGARAGARPLASDMDLEIPVGAIEAGVVAVVAVAEAAAAGKLDLTW